MLVESGLVLALELPKVKVGGGVYTPAACQVCARLCCVCTILVVCFDYTVF